MPASFPNHDLFQEWRTADRQAHALETAISKAALAALENRGPEPTQTDRDRAHKLRHVADDLFALAMAQMKATAEANRR